MAELQALAPGEPVHANITDALQAARRNAGCVLVTGSLFLVADALAALPVAIAHGSSDSIIGVDHSRHLVRQLLARGVRCHYTELPEGDHDAPLQVPLSGLLDFVLSNGSPTADHLRL